MIKTYSLIKRTSLFLASIFSLLLLSACQEFVIWGSYVDRSRNDYVIVYQKATQPLAANIVIVGDGFLKKDNQPGEKWDKKGRNCARDFLNAPIIRDYKKHYNVFIYYAESDSSTTGAGFVTPFNPDGIDNEGAAKIDYAVLDSRLRMVPQINEAIKTAERKGIKSYNTLYIDNRTTYGWHAGVDNVLLAWGEMGINAVVHELVGHNMSGLRDEYNNVGSSGLNTPTQAFPNGSNISQVKFPDVPGGAMAWADAIFGDKKGDVFFDTVDAKRKYFFNNPKWEPAMNSSEPWVSTDNKGTNWGNTDWQNWPPWVVFMGRRGYADVWMYERTGGTTAYRAEIDCTMRSNSSYLCVICRYRIWAEIHRRAYGRDMNEFFIKVPGYAPNYGYKFPSEAGLREFVPYDRRINYGRY